MEKVVCIVKNDLNAPQNGLRLTFSHKQNDFIEKYLYKYNIGTEEIECFFPQEKKCYLIINKDGVQLADNVNETDDWDIILVSDTLPIDKYSHCLFTESTLFMHHSTPPNSCASLSINSNKSIKEGAHVQHEKYGYARLFSLTESWIDGKFESQKYDAALQHIKDWFNVNDELEAKLELLHNCLVPDSIPEILDNLLSSYATVFTEFKDEIKGITLFDEKYIEALTEFRNTLLGT
ncbi:MAG: hypothetical protein WCL70_03375 [Paludibacter sp.]